MGAARAGDLVPTFTPGSGGAQEPWGLGAQVRVWEEEVNTLGPDQQGRKGGSDAALDGYALLVQMLRALRPV